MAAFKTQKEKMDDQRSYLVVKDNALIQKAKYNLTANEQKLVNYVITMIKPGEEEFKKYEIRALDFARLCGIDPKNVYRDFRNMIDSIDEKAFWVNIDNRVIKLRWFNEPEYNERKGTISLILDSPTLTPDAPKLIRVYGDPADGEAFKESIHKFVAEPPTEN